MPQVSYAISPGLYDWERDKWEKQDAIKTAEDERFNDYMEWFINNNVDMDAISECISNALSNQAGNEKAQADFEMNLFQLLGGNFYRKQAALGNIEIAIKKYLAPVIREEWQKHR